MLKKITLEFLVFIAGALRVAPCILIGAKTMLEYQAKCCLHYIPVHPWVLGQANVIARSKSRKKLKHCRWQKFKVLCHWSRRQLGLIKTDPGSNQIKIGNCDKTVRLAGQAKVTEWKKCQVWIASISNSPTSSVFDTLNRTAGTKVITDSRHSWYH